jgi:biopolymer transport protein ExbB
VKPETEQADALLFERIGEAGRLVLRLEGTAIYAEFTDAEGNVQQTPGNGSLAPGAWHHVALVLTAGRMSLFLDGNETAYTEAAFPAMQGDITLGNSAESLQGFVGELDEWQMANVARNGAWMQAAVSSQGLSPSLLVYGEDAAQEGSGGEPSYFAVTLSNVTADGWVVIVILTVMAAISWVVMFSKGMTISRIRKDNAAFQEKFADLGAAGDIEALDSEETEEERQLRDSPLLMALSGSHEHFESSTLARIYHSGVHQMQQRMAKSAGAQASRELELSPQAIDAIRATMDGTLTRENQRLNSQMVLLTIAISGGPFLGLLGTVVGVMITFAAIAASGDVNVNAIAPGIAAALVATVAGLAVAIPALFGYNYLGSRIKEISADMHVFVDEFVARIAEQHS